MSSAYLLLLSLAIGWFYLRTDRAFSSFMLGLMALICFFWGFGLAPWHFQILIIILVVNLYKFYLPKVSS